MKNPMRWLAPGLCVLLLGLTGCGDSHDALAADGLAAMQEFNGILTGITDEASAQAAKSKLDALADRMEALRKRRDALGQPTKEQEAELKKKYEEQTKELTKEMGPNMMRLMFDPKLSVHLKGAFEKLNTTMKP